MKADKPSPPPCLGRHHHLYSFTQHSSISCFCCYSAFVLWKMLDNNNRNNFSSPVVWLCLVAQFICSLSTAVVFKVFCCLKCQDSTCELFIFPSFMIISRTPHASLTDNIRASHAYMTKTGPVYISYFLPMKSYSVSSELCWIANSTRTLSTNG